MKVYSYLAFAVLLFTACNGTMANKDKSANSKKSIAMGEVIKLPSGTELVFHKDGNTENGQVGNMMFLHIVNRIEDSTIFDSKKMMGEPAPVLISEAKYNGDIQEVLTYLGPGDSATVRILADSFFRNGNMPDFVKSGDHVVMTLDVVDLKTQEQIKEEREKAISEQKGIDDKKLKDYFASKNINPKKYDEGFYMLIEKEGTGPKPSAGQRVKVNYTGMKMDGEKFDSNVDPAFKHVEPFSFTVNNREVIQGWDLAFANLKEGSKATIFLPSYLAYGQNPPPGANFGPNEILVFELEFLEILDN